MPAFGADDLLERDQIGAVTEYVLRVSEQEHDDEHAVKHNDADGFRNRLRLAAHPSRPLLVAHPMTP